jgi:hypothetical protein
MASPMTKSLVALHCRCDPNGQEPCLGGCGYLCQRLAEERIRPLGLITYEEYLKRRAAETDPR